jgi:hypothetical protein
MASIKSTMRFGNYGKILEYADFKIDRVKKPITVIGCPNLPRGNRKNHIRIEHLKELFAFANKRYNQATGFRS